MSNFTVRTINRRRVPIFSFIQKATATRRLKRVVINLNTATTHYYILYDTYRVTLFYNGEYFILLFSIKCIEYRLYYDIIMYTYIEITRFKLQFTSGPKILNLGLKINDILESDIYILDENSSYIIINYNLLRTKKKK
jgi:hypothetical protein